MNEEERRTERRRLLILGVCGVALLWEFMGRPLVMIFRGDCELPPSMLKEIVSIVTAFGGLPF